MYVKIQFLLRSSNLFCKMSRMTDNKTGLFFIHLHLIKYLLFRFRHFFISLIIHILSTVLFIILNPTNQKDLYPKFTRGGISCSICDCVNPLRCNLKQICHSWKFIRRCCKIRITGGVCVRKRSPRHTNTQSTFNFLIFYRHFHSFS